MKRVTRQSLFGFMVLMALTAAAGASSLDDDGTSGKSTASCGQDSEVGPQYHPYQPCKPKPYLSPPQWRHYTNEKEPAPTTMRLIFGEMAPEANAVAAKLAELIFKSAVATRRYHSWSLPRYEDKERKGMINYPQYIARNTINVAVPLVVSLGALSQVRKGGSRLRLYCGLPIFVGMAFLAAFNFKRAVFDWPRNGELWQWSNEKEIDESIIQELYARGDALKEKFEKGRI